MITSRISNTWGHHCLIHSMTSNAVKPKHGLQLACNKLEKIWKSKLDRTIKIKFFRACVESILLYVSETWTVTQAFEERINGCYTQLLRRVLDISWRDHQTNKKVYGDIPPLSVSLRKRRLQFADHCLRTSDQPVSNLILTAL